MKKMNGIIEYRPNRNPNPNPNPTDTHTHTHTQPFYVSVEFVRDNPGEPVLEETFTHYTHHGHQSSQSAFSIYYEL